MFLCMGSSKTPKQMFPESISKNPKQAHTRLGRYLGKRSSKHHKTGLTKGSMSKTFYQTNPQKPDARVSSVL
jgi:hypothetical protein